MSSVLLRQYVEHGWLLVPIPAGQKGPVNKSWNERKACISDPDVAEYYDGNIGLAHAYSGTCCIDLDDVEGSREWFTQRGIDLDDLLNADTAVRIHSGRENRAKLLYALPAPLPSFKFGAFELRCASSTGKTVQDVLPPSIHPDTGKPYEWYYPNDIIGHWSNLPELPEVLAEQWESLVTPAIRIKPAARQLRPNLGQAREWLFRTPSDCGYDRWIRCGMALHHETNGGLDGLDLWDEWSQRGQKYKGRADLEAHWQSFSNTGKEALATLDSLRTDDPAQAEEFDICREDPVAQIATKSYAELAEKLKGLPREKSGKYLTLLPSLTTILSVPEITGQHIAYDGFKDAIVISEEPDVWREFRQTDYTALRIWFEVRAGFNPVSHDLIRDAVIYTAEGNKMDTAQVWLSGLEWDGIPRIEKFLPNYFGTIDTDYERAVGLYIWTALAGRVMSPGCAVDMVPILIGPQGVGKSTGIAAMVPNPEFFLEVRLDETDDTIARKLRGVLICEIAEMRGLRTADLEHIKAFVTRKHEKWIPKYVEFATTFARRCLMIGTSNDEELFTDEENRRWLPIRTPGVNVPAIERDRDQLWAEGFHTWMSRGVCWQDAETRGRDTTAEFEVQDVWEQPIVAWLTEETRQVITLSEVLIHAIGIDVRQINRSNEVRAARVLRKLGWEKKLMRLNHGKPQRAWVKK